MAFAASNNTVMISDGGLATELEARGHDLSDHLWSARLLFDAPDEIMAAHIAFYRAGAAIATTASYQASFDGFAAGGIDIDEAEALVGLVRQLGVAAWLSYTISGRQTRAGQPLSEAFAVAAGAPEIVAVGVNCCAPGDVLPAIEMAREVTDKPVIVYPNSGEEWDGVHRTWIGTARWSSDLPPPWVAAGARIVGGCCRVLPDDIAELANAIVAM